MKKIIQVEGITLRSISYLEHDRIVSIMTKEEGLISFIAPRIITKKSLHLSLMSPFCQGEFHLQEGRKELYRFLDGSTIDLFLDLKKTYGFLNCATQIAKALLDYSLPSKHCDSIYSLTRSYFKQIPKTKNLDNILLSFLLKILSKEGLLYLVACCNHCKTMPAEYLQKGEAVCRNHKTQEAIPFTREEIQLLQMLTYSRSFSLIDSLSLPHPLILKTKSLFNELLG